MEMTKKSIIWIACAIPKLSTLSNPITMPMAELRTSRQTRSISQAIKRVTGPASNCEKTIPSGVLTSKALVLVMGSEFCVRRFPIGSGPAEEEDEQHQFDDAKTNFDPIRNNRLVILREKRFYDARPDEH